MSNETQELTEMGTKPLTQHEWLQKLIGNWRTETEMTMPDGSKETARGTENVRDIGGLWSFGEGNGTMPGGAPLTYFTGLGFDVTFKEYRGFTMMSASSHLWKHVGHLSPDGRVMTLDCEGPNMMGEGTAMYRDTIEILDNDRRTLTTEGQDENGEWHLFMKVNYTRA